MALIFIYVMTNELNILGLCMFLLIMIVKSFDNFNIVLFILLLICSFYILDIIPLTSKYCKSFLPFCVLPFYSLYANFWLKVINFNEENFINIQFYNLPFWGSSLKKPFLSQNHKNVLLNILPKAFCFPPLRC